MLLYASGGTFGGTSGGIRIWWVLSFVDSIGLGGHNMITLEKNYRPVLINNKTKNGSPLLWCVPAYETFPVVGIDRSVHLHDRVIRAL